MTAPDETTSTPPASDASEAAVADGGVTELPEAYVIPRALAQATLDYLASRPYREVFGLVRAFEALEPLPPQDPERRP